MATTIVNVSGGNLHLDSINVMLIPGERKDFEASEADLLVSCHELVAYKSRGRVLFISEPAAEAPPETTSPEASASEVASEPVAPAAPVAHDAVADAPTIDTQSSKKPKNKKKE